MPGGFASIVAINAERPLQVTDKPLALRGTLRLLSDRRSNLLYQLDKALPA
jgi:hypothetical protein